MKKNKRALRGDTLIEVMFAIGIFAAVSISVTTLMNNMLGKSQSAIEIVMARTEIDAQAEALRFIHSSYKNDTMREVWSKIVNNARDEIGEDFLENVTACSDVPNYAFYINSFELGNLVDGAEDSIYIPAKKIDGNSNITAASTFPRILHKSDDGIMQNFGENESDSKAEGIWVIAVKGDTSLSPEYYDFYIQTCWHSIGNSMPSTISTIVRLRNPDKTSSAGLPLAGTCPGGVAKTTIIFKDYDDNTLSSRFECPGTSVAEPSASREGYTFTNWKNNDTGEEKTSGFKTPSSGTETWTAQYEPIPAGACTGGAAKTTIIFKDPDGVQLSSYSECPGTSVAAPASANRTGYSLSWKKEGATTEKTSGFKTPSSGTETWIAQYALINYKYKTSKVYIEGSKVGKEYFEGSLTCEKPSATIKKIRRISPNITFTINSKSKTYTHTGSGKYQVTITLNCSGNSIDFNLSGT